jgi:hypothetical protein
MNRADRNAGADATFTLERFAWEAPDRLEISGWFAGLGDARTEPPVLLMRGAEREHRLPVAPGCLSGPPEEGQHWQATFAWQEPPEAFDVAELELGGDIVVELPEPATGLEVPRDQILEVRRPCQSPAQSPSEDLPAGGGAERLRLQAELVATQEEIRSVTAAAERAREEAVRARADLESERERQAVDAERFREGLASVQDAAGREIDALHQRMAVLERAGEEADRLRSDLEQARERAEAAESRLRDARRPAAKARREAERLLQHLTSVEGALDDRGGADPGAARN